MSKKYRLWFRLFKWFLIFELGLDIEETVIQEKVETTPDYIQAYQEKSGRDNTNDLQMFRTTAAERNLGRTA